MFSLLFSYCSLFCLFLFVELTITDVVPVGVIRRLVLLRYSVVCVKYLHVSSVLICVNVLLTQFMKSKKWKHFNIISHPPLITNIKPSLDIFFFFLYFLLWCFPCFLLQFSPFCPCWNLPQYHGLLSLEKSVCLVIINGRSLQLYPTHFWYPSSERRRRYPSNSPRICLVTSSCSWPYQAILSIFA